MAATAGSGGGGGGGDGGRRRRLDGGGAVHRHTQRTCVNWPNSVIPSARRTRTMAVGRRKYIHALPPYSKPRASVRRPEQMQPSASVRARAEAHERGRRRRRHGGGGGRRGSGGGGGGGGRGSGGRGGGGRRQRWHRPVCSRFQRVLPASAMRPLRPNVSSRPKPSAPTANSDHREAHDHLEQRGEVKAAGALRGPSVAARLHHF